MDTSTDRDVRSEVDHMAEMVAAFRGIHRAGRNAALRWFVEWANALEASDRAAEHAAAKLASEESAAAAAAELAELERLADVEPGQ